MPNKMYTRVGMAPRATVGDMLTRTDMPEVPQATRRPMMPARRDPNIVRTTVAYRPSPMRKR
jgi:hypothetical protein